MTDSSRFVETASRRDRIHSTRATARKAVMLYLLILILAPFNHSYISSRFIVPHDAAATAHNISANLFGYRLGILSGLAAEVLFLFLAWSLYQMLRDVDRKHARLMVTLVAISVGIGLVNLLNQTMPLILRSGAPAWSAYTTPQRDALAYTFLRLRGMGVTLATALWGLWLLPFGILVFKSRFFPRPLGLLLIVGFFASLAVCVTAILSPVHRPLVERAMLPFYVSGEVAMIVWLLLKGAREPRLEVRPYPAT